MNKSKYTKADMFIAVVELAAGITAGKITDTFGKTFLGKKSKLIYKLGMAVLDFTAANYAMHYADKVLNMYKAKCKEVIDHYNERKAEYEEEQMEEDINGHEGSEI